MNEKRKIEQDLDADSAERRTNSDVAPKQSAQSTPPVRHISGMRPAVHLPAPSVPPAPLTPEDLLEDGWDDEDDDSGPTLLDTHGSVPPDLVAEARAISDPLGQTGETNEIRTREVATREVPTRAFSRDEAPTNRLILPPDAITPLAPVPAEPTEQDDEEFSHDDFPTRQTPMGLQEALLAYPSPSDSHRGLHETMPAPEESLPDLPSSAALAAPPVSPAFPPISPLAPTISADETAQMPHAPALPRPDELSQPPPPAERSSVSKISQVSQISQVSHPSQSSHPSQVSQPVRSLMYPTPTSITGAPLPHAHTVRFAFLRNLSPNNDPPLNRLALVALLSFCATLLVCAFIAWVIVLARH